MSDPMTLSDILKGGTRGVNFFRRISVSTLVPLDLECGAVKHLGRGVYIWVSHVPMRKAWTPAFPDFGTSYIRPHGMTRTSQILHNDERKFLAGRPHPFPKFFHRMLTRDLQFLIANLLVLSIMFLITNHAYVTCCLRNVIRQLRRAKQFKHVRRQHSYFVTRSYRIVLQTISNLYVDYMYVYIFLK